MRKISFIITNHIFMIVLKLLQFHILLQKLVYWAVNLIVLHLNCCIASFYTDENETSLWYYIYKIITTPCENSKTVSFASSRMKQNLVFPALSKFTVKLICWVALEQTFILPAFTIEPFITIEQCKNCLQQWITKWNNETTLMIDKTLAKYS